MANNYTYDLRIYSNDGSTIIWENKTIVNISYTISSTGVSGTNGNYIARWVYIGNRTFAGLATSANQSAAGTNYAVGKTFTVGSGNTSASLNLYLVETGTASGGTPETVPAQLAISYNNQSLYNSSISSEITKTLVCNGKLMSGNVSVTVTPGSGSGGAANVQTATGTFTAPGKSERIVTCGFTPDVVVIELPEDYLENTTTYKNNLTFRLSGMEYHAGIAFVGNTSTEYHLYGGYCCAAQNGFSVWNTYWEDFSGDFGYDNTYTLSYTAIKFT